MTNIEKIRAMSDEEFAAWRSESGLCPPYYFEYERCLSEPCRICWLNWLKAEVEDAEKPF